MKKTHRGWAGIALVASLVACDDFLTTEPQTIITDDQVWSDAALITNVLANFYDRLPLHQSLPNGSFEQFANYDEGVWSGVTAGAQARNSAANYPYNYAAWSLWAGGSGYGLIRDINLALENIEAGTLAPAQKTPILAELRFLRAQMYFELVKRNGGVPLITEQKIYDFSGNAEPLQEPRASEAEVYDFIASEVDAIVGQLGNEGSKWRANRYTALALKSRAMLYAGSIARYNSVLTPSVTLPGGEVGIPASRADEYFQKSLDASREIIESNQYALVSGSDQAAAFASIFSSKPNSEVIFAEDYMVSQGKNHFFTMQLYPQSIPHAINANWGGSAISPALQLVESYDYLDGRPGELLGTGDGTVAGQANWIFYDEIDDIFEGKDQRMFGTVITPGSSFAGQPVQIQAGVYVWNDGQNRYDRVAGVKGSTYSDGGLQTGLDGPVAGEVYVSATGFLVRKHLDPSPQGALITGTDNWWVLYRLGEIYMNAAEAAFELGQTSDALTYINRLRERAGFPPNSLTTLTLEKIQSERWAELAFEDHRLWDLKRWRIAHIRLDGSNPETAVVKALWPYRIYRPGHPNHNKYVFDEIPAPVQTAPRFFRLGNYYAQIPEAAINANPKLVRNPLQ
jgi:hypothetical protein